MNAGYLGPCPENLGKGNGQRAAEMFNPHKLCTAGCLQMPWEGGGVNLPCPWGAFREERHRRRRFVKWGGGLEIYIRTLWGTINRKQT